MASKPLTIAIAGSDGRVGAAVVTEALAQGHTVVGIDATREDLVKPRPRFTYKKVDTRDFESYLEAVRGCDALIHLAATMRLYKDDEGNRTRKTADHEVHNYSVAMSFNALSVAEELGINRVVLASSINAMGMLYSKDPKYDYLPLTEDHPRRPEDAYSLSKLIVEVQADAFARRLPSMRIATMRFHWIVPDEQVTIERLQQQDSWKDLWGYTPVGSAAKACLAALTVPEDQFPLGHETFWIVASTTAKQADSYDLLQTKFAYIKDLRADFTGTNRGFYDTSKAERLLGWNEVGFPWKA